MSQLRVTGNAIISGAGQSLQLTSASDVYLNVTRGASILNIGIDATGSFYNTSTSHRFFTNSGTINALTIASTGAATFSSSVTATQAVINSGAANNYINFIQNSNQIGYVGDANWIFGGSITDFGIRATNNLVFGIGAIERMRITSGGAINIKDGTLTGGGGFEFTSEAFFGARFQSNAYKFMAGNNSTEYMRITSSGNVLIGTTTDAGQKLQVNGTSIFSGLLTNYNVYNTQTASYTLVIGDASKIVEMNVGSANTVTVPTNASVGFPIGTEITVMQYGAGVTTIASAGGVTINSKDNARIIANRYTGATLVKRGTDEWYLIGNIVV